jgi:hypothetical protein
MTWLYRLHFVYLVALAASVVCLAWLARVHDRD